VPGDAPSFLKNFKDPKEVLPWSMHSIPVESGYIAALVAEGSDMQLKQFYLPSTIR
jgi:hypothetical protein